MRVQTGVVPELSSDTIYRDPYFRLSKDGFVFSTPRGVKMHFSVGGQVTLECPSPAHESEAKLYLWGTVFGAVAWLNGMMPLHCSAISGERGTVAFTAPSGGGKSTIAAALSAHLGCAHFCDDTLIVVEDDLRPVAIPDGKPVKLWDDALGHTGLEPREEIHLLPGKHYAQAPSTAYEPASLTDLIFLDAGDAVSLDPVLGSAKLELLAEAIYRGHIHEALANREFHNRMMLMIAKEVRFWRMARPISAAGFAENLTKTTALLRENELI